VRSVLVGGQLAEAGWFNPGYLAQLLAQHESGIRDHSTPIWALLMFDAFLRNAMEMPQSVSSLKVAV
jgi:asparagine synthase (glutamine-hydrolysing)